MILQVEAGDVSQEAAVAPFSPHAFQLLLCQSTLLARVQSYQPGGHWLPKHVVCGYWVPKDVCFSCTVTLFSVNMKRESHNM